MKTLIGHAESYYAASAIAAVEYPYLDGDIDADVCIIGGGYTGLSSALHLAEQGYKVVLLEAVRLAWGASGRNGGHVGVGQRRSQTDLEEALGINMAQQLWCFSLEAVQLVENLISRFQIQCDLKRGIMHLASKLSHAEYLKKEAERLFNIYGYDKIRYVEKEEVRTLVGTDRYIGAQVDMGSLHIHPLNFALGVAAAGASAGVRFFEYSRVEEYTDEAPFFIKTARGRVRADKIILACNGYLGSLEPRLAGRIMPINNFVLATEPLGPSLARELISNDYAVQDTLFVINYWKLSGDNRLIFGGGENYTKHFPRDIRAFVRRYMLRVYPQLAHTKVEFGWGGTLAITVNRMPGVGQLRPGIFYSQGYSGHGVPTAIFAGKLLAEAISGDGGRFHTFSAIPQKQFPGGVLLRWPGLVAAMLYHSLMDKIGR
ncbi:NAD(P)/FAD-dependent oxidoreductase [Microbulbifer okhotskensis]|uniref:NAD(P)/FAD-dependent oxidoreductase n=1 Tax=Microbulbifer okhotskensis TaxID=2926617 RepID=UPI004038C104